MAAQNPKEPRFARYRLAMLALYLVMTIGFSVLIIWSVFRSVLAMSPATPVAGPTLSVAECSSKARGLFDELDARRRAVSSEPDVTHADLRWNAFRLDWLGRSHQLESQCDLEEPSRAKLQAAFKQLDHSMELMTVNVGQFAGEVGPSLEAIRVALDDAAK